MAGDIDALILGLDNSAAACAAPTANHLDEARATSPSDQRYPGILFRFGLEGMMDRSGADLLCLNSADPLRPWPPGLGLDSANAVVRACRSSGAPSSAQPSRKTLRSCFRTAFDPGASPATPLYL